MKALVYRGPWTLAVETMADPEPGAQEVLIRVVATGICGSDIHGYTGENGRRHPGQVMGHETVGRIAGLGSGVSGMEIGALVTVNPVIACGDCPVCEAGSEQWCASRTVIGVDRDYPSAFAELLRAPARNVIVLPETIPAQYGALVEPLAVGYHAARRGGCREQDRVLVLGGGPIGQAAALAARRLGARSVVVSEPAPARRALIAGLGLEAIHPERLSSDAVAALGGPPTLVLDAVGTSRTLEDALTISALGARIVLVGMNAPTVEIGAYAVSTGERSVIGSFCYSAAHFRETAEWVGTSPPELATLIDAHTDLAGAPAAFDSLARGESGASKVLVHLEDVPHHAGVHP
ncbi:alcohol dehydrogenase catalytic domain-containing protein [Ruania suaedae]|uniref:zinc-dependent alcohol dehydrogenase n=1 Tax=Ruania suaedae TaxID=2897774 RepID=UPI001E544353|nr:alcohol dehydrogenase catalytic domain-containing protein [Ruania suaedae]UFU03953.1 alcohol dehydrogenase catalytic domain-containing protein [Ruania suaedae]